MLIFVYQLALNLILSLFFIPNSPPNENLNNLGSNINTADDEYFPTITADESVLYFTRKIGKDEDLMYSKKDNNGNWIKAVGLYPFNLPDIKEGAASISPDGNTIYLTLCNQPMSFGSCDIYYCKRVNDSTWTDLKNLGEVVNTPGWESQPCIAPDGKTLYFASNRSGGYGQIDIWKTFLQEDGSWSTPKNLGPEINTDQNEQTPFIHLDNQTLYFSSDGHQGLGKKDIFVSRKNQTGWSKPENLGAPINSDSEDFGLVVDRSSKIAYFSSYRDGGFGKSDLYQVTLPQTLRPNNVVIYKGNVVDENEKPVNEAWIEINNITKNKIIYSSAVNEFNASFLTALEPGSTYGINIIAKGYLFYSKQIIIDNNPKNDIYTLTAKLKSIKPGLTVILYNVLFDIDKYNLHHSSELELDNVAKFLEKNPKIKISVYGHTDNTFSASYNQQLSEKRAQVVYYYLLKKLMSKKQLIMFKGFGITKPIADNNTNEGKQLNRRSEIVIVE